MVAFYVPNSHNQLQIPNAEGVVNMLYLAGRPNGNGVQTF